jgi:hypothetical protein
MSTLSQTSSSKYFTINSLRPSALAKCLAVQQIVQLAVKEVNTNFRLSKHDHSASQSQHIGAAALPKKAATSPYASF